MNIEERLREKARTIQKFEQLCTDPNYTPIQHIELNDAIEITKDLFTKEQVEELRKESYTKGVEDKNNLMRDYENLLIDIMGKRKVSIGSLENYYDLHLEVESIDKQYSRLQQLKEK